MGAKWRRQKIFRPDEFWPTAARIFRTQVAEDSKRRRATARQQSIASENFLNFFRNFDRQFPEKNGEGNIWQARGRLQEEELWRQPLDQDSPLRLSFPFANGLLLGSRFDQQMKPQR